MKSVMKNDNNANKTTGNHANGNNKKNLKSAAKKRNNNNNNFEYSIDESSFLEMAENAENNYGQNKKFSIEELFVDFEKPLQIYAFLGLRNKYHPVFLTRNLSYMGYSKKIRTKRSLDEVISDLSTKKQSQLQRQGIKSLRLSFLSLQLQTPTTTVNNNTSVNKNSDSHNGNGSAKKRPKFENGRSSSIGNKAFIEVYSSELNLLGKCEITNLIESKTVALNTSAKSIIEIDANDFEICRTKATVLFFRLVYFKDVEIEFTNTFNMQLDSSNLNSNQILSINLYEMMQNFDHSRFPSALHLIYEHKSSNKLFHVLPKLKFQIDIQENSSIVRRSNTTKLNGINYSSSSSIMHQSPLTSPIRSQERTSRKLTNGHTCSNSSSKRNSSVKKVSDSSYNYGSHQKLSDDLELYYQFSGKHNIKIVTRFDRNTNKSQLFLCPFCYLNCNFIEALLKHFACNHFRFDFECIPNAITPSVNRIQLNFSINQHYNGSHAGNCYDAHSAYGHSMSRHQPMKRIPVTFIYVCKKTNLDYSNEAIDINIVNEIKAMSVTNGLEKCFYHSRSCTVIDAHELNNDLVDSDSELDPEWLKEQTGLFIQEFADVNQGEKELMRLWNLHILHNNFISDSQVYLACETFIEKSRTHIIANNLVNNFYLHLANLSDYGLLDANKITKLSDLLFSIESDLKNEKV